MSKKVLHIITVSFVINHFFGSQFKYLKSRTGNRYFLGCSPSKEFYELSHSLEYEMLEVDVTRSISPIRDIKAIYKIFKFIRKNDIDVVVGHTPKGGMVAMIASHLAGIKTRIYFRHGIIYETSVGFKRFLLKNIDRLSGYLASKVVCVSEGVRQISERDKLNSPDKNVILGLGTCNGIDSMGNFNPNRYSSEFRDKLRLKWGISRDDIVIGYVGRLVKDKGIDDLLQAWSILEKKYQGIKLLLVGPIERRDSISDISKKSIEENPNIISTGFVLDSSSFFSVMDMFILPTYREGFPTVSLEASSMQLPVLITRATGCTEAVIDGQTGLFITNNVEDIVDKVAFYINNKSLAKLHGSNGREFVLSNFEQTKIWDQIFQKLKY